MTSQMGGLIFLSCGQMPGEEKKLGKDVCDLITELTPHRPYYAENQSSFDGVTTNILRALDEAIALIAIMHHRGRIVFPNSSEAIRASVWVEQEIAIAAYIGQVLGRNLTVAAYVQDGIRLEGLREKIILNAKTFMTNSEVLDDLRTILPSWKDLPVTLKSSGPPKLRFNFERGEAANYLFRFVNEESDDIIVKEILLSHDGVELTDPLRPNPQEKWIVSAEATQLIGKPILSGSIPAAVLADLRDPKQISQFVLGTLDVTILCVFRNQLYQLTRKFSVRVNRFTNTIDRRN